MNTIEVMKQAQPVAFLLNGMRFKLTIVDGMVGCFGGLEDELDGQWVALVDATDGKHLNPAPAIPAGWQPIETAPKDGTFILVWNSNGINEVYWNESEGFWHHDVDFDCTFPLRGDFPTLWIHLPQPPKEAT